jgi:methenyltetrahydromethanopterin cyclohydrolase
MNLNEKTYKAIRSLSKKSSVHEYDSGRVRIYDVGLKKKPSLETALKVAEASLGCLGSVTLKEGIFVQIPTHPAVATIGCQLAGWRIDLLKGVALGSGPARLLANKPSSILSKVAYSETSEKAALVLETDTLPDSKTLESVLKATGAEDLVIAAFSGSSLVGQINVLARIVEVGVFRLMNLGYDINKITSAEGSVPLIRLGKDSMFEANDAIIYHGSVSLALDGWDPALSEQAVSRSSAAYGKPFKQIFEEAGKNFYNIPSDLFAPASLTVKDNLTGRTHTSA